MMATYFNGGGSEIQADNLQTLYLMNPSYSVDSQTTPPGMLYLNQASVQHAPHPHHLVGIPLSPQEDYNRWEAMYPVGFHHRRRQGLSLSLNNSTANKNVDRSPTSASGVSSGVIGGIFGCKYMKAAEQLLDEVVNVGKVMKMEVKEYKSVVNNVGKVMKMELSTAQRQELQMKKAKLLNMLDEVEQRYRQYHSQMQVVASSYEQAAGPGSAKSYTSLALNTISKQFRCLKDTIASQIKATGRSLGEEEEEEEEGEGRSRLRLVDQQMRQQRVALHQIGMMQHHPHNAWRPQRGLPEKAVSALRAWLFDHFLHPYPKDSDKHMLAKQTGLTRSQVSNWFINARVRLWKPMVEEMYLEETKSAQLQNDSEAQTTTTNNNNKESPPPTLQSPRITQSPKLPLPPTNSINNIPHSTIVSPSTRPTPHTFEPSLQGFSLIGQPSSGMESLIMRSPKRQRGNIVVDTQNNSPSSNLSMDHHNGFGSNYPVGDIGSRFNPHQQLGQGQYHHGGNGAVSLTLGLPHCENLLSSLSSGTHHHQQNFMPGAQAEFCTPQPSHSGVGGGGGSYEGVDIQDRKRFVAQLLSDFVV